MFSEIKIPDLARLQGKLEQTVLVGEPLRDFGRRVGVTVQGEARKLAPVDSGLLRSSIGFEVDASVIPLWAKVGTSLFYAPPQEFGSGTMGDGKLAGGPHHPPGEALEIWALRHGFKSGRQVARIIGRRGGLRPRRFLRGGLEASLGKVKGFVVALGREIERRFSAK